jgi:hypothetical protein
VSGRPVLNLAQFMNQFISLFFFEMGVKPQPLHQNDAYGCISSYLLFTKNAPDGNCAG